MWQGIHWWDSQNPGDQVLRTHRWKTPPTLPSWNTPHPPVIATHWMTPGSWWGRISDSQERSEKPSTFTRDPLPSTEAMRSPHPTSTPVTWPEGHVTSHSTIIKDHVTWSKHLGMFQLCFWVIIHLHRYYTSHWSPTVYLSGHKLLASLGSSYIDSDNHLPTWHRPVTFLFGEYLLKDARQNGKLMLI